MPQVTIVPLVGAHFRPPAKAILSVLPIDCELKLEAEPENEYDPNAVKVSVESSAIPDGQHETLELVAAGYGFSLIQILEQKQWQLGYIPRTDAPKIQPHVANASAKLNFAPDGKPTVRITIGD